MDRITSVAKKPAAASEKESQQKLVFSGNEKSGEIESAIGNMFYTQNIFELFFVWHCNVSTSQKKIVFFVGDH